MSTLRCFLHRQYLGEDFPSLECVACCGIYISRLRNLNVNQEDLPLDARQLEKQVDIIKKRAFKKMNGSSHWISTK